MRTKLKPLDPLPIEFNEEAHSYRWIPTGEVMGTSVTQILSINKTAAQLANIEKHKSNWAPRGTHVHAALEHKLKGLPFEMDPTYGAWVCPLVDHWFWEGFQPLAVEYRVCDLKRGIGGSMDALGVDGWTGRTVLLDLKSQSSAKYGTYSTDAQLGAYLAMLQLHHNIQIDELLTVWSRPGECLLGDPQNVDECLAAWENTYEKWEALHEEI